MGAKAKSGRLNHSFQQKSLPPLICLLLPLRLGAAGKPVEKLEGELWP